MPKAGASHRDLHKPECGRPEHVLTHPPLARIVVADALLDGGKDHLKGVNQPVGQEDEDEEGPGPVAGDDTDLQCDRAQQADEDHFADRVDISDGVLACFHDAVVGDEEGDGGV